MDSKLIIILTCLLIDLSNVEATAKHENNTDKTKEEKNNGINEKIIRKCDKLIDKLKNSDISDKEKYIDAFQKIRSNFSRNSGEIKYLYKISAAQKIQKMDEYLSKLSRYVNNLSEQCQKVLDSNKKYEDETVEEIKKKYKNFEK